MAIVIGGGIIAGVGFVLADVDLFGTDVPTKDSARSCTVRRGDQRTEVVANCGEGCGQGIAAKGACSGGWNPFCGNKCDIYNSVAVCYLFQGSEVVQVVTIPGAGVTAFPCKWTGNPTHTEPRAGANSGKQLPAPP